MSKEIVILAMRVIRASHNSTIDSISIDKLKNQINREYPKLGSGWPYRWAVNDEQFEKIINETLS